MFALLFEQTPFWLIKNHLIELFMLALLFSVVVAITMNSYLLPYYNYMIAWTQSWIFECKGQMGRQKFKIILKNQSYQKCQWRLTKLIKNKNKLTLEITFGHFLMTYLEVSESQIKKKKNLEPILEQKCNPSWPSKLHNWDHATTWLQGLFLVLKENPRRPDPSKLLFAF